MSRSDLMARIAARSPRIAVTDEGPLYALVTVRSPRAGSVVADLVLGTAGAAQAPRRVAARSCAEVADGVAFIIAVTFDPSLKRRLATGSDQSGKSAEGGEAAAAARPGASTADSSPIEPGGPPSPPAPKPDERPSPPGPPAPLVTTKAVAPPIPVQSARTTKRQFGATAAGQTIFGPAPTVMPGIALYAMAALDRDGLWAPALFLGATHVWRSDLSEPGGRASFTLDAASLDACPLRLRWSRLAARPCASALVGRLAARGSDTDQGTSSARPFAAAGAVIVAGFGSTVEVTARVGAAATLIRDSYEFAANVFHRAEPVTVSASLGIGALWP
jgi:hypothetical protein